MDGDQKSYFKDGKLHYQDLYVLGESVNLKEYNGDGKLIDDWSAKK